MNQFEKLAAQVIAMKLDPYFNGHDKWKDIVKDAQEAIKAEITSRQRIDDTLYFTLPDGKIIYIGPLDLDFFYQLQKLPAETKIEMMNLSSSEMENSINHRRQIKKQQLLQHLSKRWAWRTTGDPYPANGLDTNEHCLAIRASYKEIVSKVLKDKVSNDIMDKMISFFEGDEVFDIDEK